MWMAGSIVSRLELDSSGFVQGMMAAQAMGRLFPGFVQSFLANPLLGVVDLLKTTGSAMVGWVRGFLDSATAFNDMSESLGVSAGQLSELAAAMGGGAENARLAADAYRFLAKSADSAAQGNQQMLEIFARLGIDADDVSDGLMDLPRLLRRVSDGMRELGPGSQAATAMQLLGESGYKLNEVLRGGSGALDKRINEAKSFGATMSAAGSEFAERWKQSFLKIGWAWEGFKNNFALGILEGVMPYAERFTNWLSEHKEKVKELAIEWGMKVVAGVKTLIPVLMEVAKHIQTITVLTAAFKGMQFGAKWGLPGMIIGATTFGTAAYGLTESLRRRVETDYDRNIAQVKQEFNITNNFSDGEQKAGREDKLAKRISDSIKNEMQRQDYAQRVRRGL